jgi:hypothetical protein
LKEGTSKQRFPAKKGGDLSKGNKWQMPERVWKARSVK